MPSETDQRPRVAVPFRSWKDEASGATPKDYLRAIEAAGGKPVLLSLATLRTELDRVAHSLDAIVLPGSSADVDPARYRAARHSATADPDQQREQTDVALLDHALAEGKPVLAICYGVQSLNVYLGGSLVQDIPSEISTAIKHDRKGLRLNAPDPEHAARIEANSLLAQLAGSAEARVNSSHHQAILEPGKNLRIVAHAPDGVIEAVEWTGTNQWVVGVQWHPERMTGDPLALALFRTLVAAARHRVHT